MYLDPQVGLARDLRAHQPPLHPIAPLWSSQEKEIEEEIF